jgi:LmbE family N-acetylglucosaminyl deacetylase
MTGEIHLVTAPHPDDELFGCGGTLLRACEDGHETHWAIVTEMTEDSGYSTAQIRMRSEEIDAVALEMGFVSHRSLGFPPAGLTSGHMGRLIDAIGSLIDEINPNVFYLPFYGDVHSDHRIVFDAAIACTKWFRYPSIAKVLCYEVLSETEMSIHPGAGAFQPNLFMDISAYPEKKQTILQHYASELGGFPFPRSPEAVSAQAAYRGATAGFAAAEAFMILRERH